MLNKAKNVVQRRAGRVAALLGLLMGGCTDAYLPDVIKNPEALLVVDGFINPQGTTSFRLSRSYAVGSNLAPPPETRAAAYVEEEGGARYTLRESPLGTYTAALTLNPAKKYRLHLNTTGGQEYASDYVPVKITPAIDAVNWRIENDNLNVTVDTHDATNRTRYYRWETDETWEIRPAYGSTLEYFNHSVIPIRVPYPLVCYGSQLAANVQIEKTTALTQDVVAGYRLKTLPATSERLFTRYSLQVRQHALTQEEYLYWELLRKNTESIGSLFDAQPTQLTGNVRCLSNPATPALGYVGAHTLVSQRIFIVRADLPSSLSVRSGYEACVPPFYLDLYPPIFMPPKPPEIIEAAFGTASPEYYPVSEVKNGFGDIIAYLAAKRDCLDCRTRGASVKPSFWP